MQIGLLLGGLTNAAALGALAQEAEALGFASLWAGDHIAFPGPILDPLQLLACFASHTQHVRLGTCVYLLPLRHPTVVAKMVSSLDFISGGRVIFGVGVGGEFPGEFAASGVPVNERGARTNEAITVLRRLWRGDQGEHAGKFFRIGPIQLKPPPAQTGGPPIWIGGRSDAALRRTARYGDGYVGYLLSPDGFRERCARIRTLVAELGPAAGVLSAGPLPVGPLRAAKSDRLLAHAERPITGALMTFAVVDRDRTAAVQRAGAMLGAMYARDMLSAAERYCVVGDAAACRDAVARYAAAGVEHLILTPLAYGDGTLEQVRALAEALELRR
jgi:probable F420-dependent oxidoreductase